MRHEFTNALRDMDSTRAVAAARPAAAQSPAGGLAASLALRNALVAAGRLDSARAIEELRRGILRTSTDTASLFPSDVNETLMRAECAASMPPEIARVQRWSIATARGELLLADRNGVGALAAFRGGDSISRVPCAVCRVPGPTTPVPTTS